MDFSTLAEKRYSLRKFSDRVVTRDTIERILRAAQLAPTACNYQPQHIYVLQSDAALASIRQCSSHHFDAPLVLLICYDRNQTWKRPSDGQCSGLIDASIITTHLMLQIAELGLGSTWVGSFNPADVSKALQLPANIVPVALLPMGYPADDATPAAMHKSRKPLNDTVTWR
jgi:nitroreductase